MQGGWDVLDGAAAGLVRKGQFLGMAAAATAIVIPISTPGYLHALFQLLEAPMVNPDSSDPQAKMRWDPARAKQAMGEFGLVLGMLEETNFLDAPHMDDAWVPAVTAGVRFIYYHELGHVVHAQVQQLEMPCWLEKSELEDPHLPFEMVADQFGLSMLLLEFRRHRHLMIPAMVGVVIAMGLTAMQAYVGPDGPARMHPIRRMNRLFDWAKKAATLGQCTDEAIIVATHFWNSLYSYFAAMPEASLPSPLFSLLRQTSQRPRSDWTMASGHMLQWCAYGNRRRVLTALRSIRDQALARADDERARGVLEVIDFVVKDLRDIDDALGLSTALE